jgi:hypothetical protein
MDCVCSVDNAIFLEGILGEVGSGSPYAILGHKYHRRVYGPFMENVSEQRIRKGSWAYIVAFLLTNLAGLAFNAFPWVGTHKIGDRAKIHARWMA